MIFVVLIFVRFSVWEVGEWGGGGVAVFQVQRYKKFPHGETNITFWRKNVVVGGCLVVGNMLCAVALPQGCSRAGRC